jgi:MFS family permease
MNPPPHRLARLLPLLPSRLPGWIALWLLLVAAIVAGGGIAGALLFPLAGSLIGMSLTPLQMAANGLRDGAFYALIWAPGVALVATIMLAHEKRRWCD